MNREEQEQLYREAMAARRAGEVCPLCGTTHSALSACPAKPEDAEPPPGARTRDVETSHEAAASGNKRALRFIVLGLYAEAGDAGLVDDDLGKLAGYTGHESYRRRGSDLRALGWTQWLMEYAKPGVLTPVRRKTHLGSTARVSIITPLGRSVWDNREAT